MPTPSTASRSRRLFLLIVRLYPGGFRDRFETELLQLFDAITAEAANSPPGQRFMATTRILSDTALGAIREQAHELKDHLKPKDIALKKTTRPSFPRRHFVSLSAAGAIVIATGIFFITGSLAYSVRVVTAGIFAERIVAAQNASNSLEADDAAAHFVKDYILVKYHGSKSDAVGYKSRYAVQTPTVEIGSNIRTAGLKQAIQNTYQSMDADFDPLTCSTTSPASVKFVRHPLTTLGLSQVTAVFTYPGSSEQNLAQYNLVLDIDSAKSPQWKVSQIDCSSLNAATTKPFVRTFDSLSGYDQRNDLTF